MVSECAGEVVGDVPAAPAEADVQAAFTGVRPCCTGLSPGIDLDGETIVHCAVCHDTGKVTPEEAERWEREMRERYGARRTLPCTSLVVPNPTKKFGDAVSTSPQAGCLTRSQGLWGLVGNAFRLVWLYV